MEELHKREGKREFIKIGRVIGQIMAELDQPVGDPFLEYRIRHLIYSEKLELKGIPKSMRHYSVRLRG